MPPVAPQYINDVGFARRKPNADGARGGRAARESALFRLAICDSTSISATNPRPNNSRAIEYRVRNGCVTLSTRKYLLTGAGAVTTNRLFGRASSRVPRYVATVPRSDASNCSARNSARTRQVRAAAASRRSGVPDHRQPASPSASCASPATGNFADCGIPL